MARKILLADDSVTAQNMGRRILSDAGYEVTTVNNGSAALKKIAESKPDLIVLDVYMPGYGGLEVCQRLRESKETARIPVLLTVGKLEPFKPEEARRVKADAFIVKPFEASELLTALTKLEDRIVPQPAPYKPGRFAKAISALEAETPSNDYGDLESGWKNRLKIPVPQSHGPEVEIEEHAEPAEPPKPEARKPQAPPPVPSVVPRDITPEEIAAINAAAAAFRTRIVEPAAEVKVASVVPETFASDSIAQAEQPNSEVTTEDEPPATFATAASIEEHQAEPERAEEEQKVEAPVAEEVKAEVAEVTATAAAEPQPELPVPVQEAAIHPPVEALPKPEERDDFAAALETLTPTNGYGVPQQLSGPRWIAELVAVTDAESALNLEQEMQKALAIMAAVNAAEFPVSVVQDTRPAAEPAQEQTTAHNAETEASTSLVAAMINETSLPSVSDLVDSVMPRASAETPAPETQGAAFAAAATGGGDAVSQSAVPSEAPQAVPATDSPEERQRESELAAAWESWKQIRESVVEPQLKSQVVSPVTEVPTPLAEAPSIAELSSQAEPSSSQQPEPEDEAGGHEESVASIVDSVLADLKPKLMEEISRKMGREKKRKS
ncbi:MAG: response regulator [Terriglobales bacterium]